MTIDQEVELLRNIPLFAKVDPAKLKLLAFASERAVFAPGETLFHQGDPGDAAFMIVSGNCRVFRNVEGRDETLGTMGPGEVFGEMAILLDEPRAASVEATDAVTVLVLDKATFTEGLGIEGWTGALVRALAQRFRDLEQKVRTSGMKRD